MRGSRGGGGSGGPDPPPPWNLQSLISPISLEMKKINYISYLCTSTVIRQTESILLKVAPPPGKIFWIRTWGRPYILLELHGGAYDSHVKETII